MSILPALALLAGCEHQYIAIPDAEVIEGTPQYAYTNVWVGQTVPTYTLTEGSLDLALGSSATVEIGFAGEFEFTVTEIVLMGLNTGDSELGIHWRYVLDEDEIAAQKAEITIHALSEAPTKEWCTPKRLGTWTCYRVADEGINGLGLSAAGDDSISLFAEVPVTLAPLESAGEPGVCDGYTVDDCCGGSAGISAVECAWDPACDCPDGTTDVGYSGDGYRRCDCPG